MWSLFTKVESTIDLWLGPPSPQSTDKQQLHFFP